MCKLNAHENNKITRRMIKTEELCNNEQQSIVMDLGKRNNLC